MESERVKRIRFQRLLLLIGIVILIGFGLTTIQLFLFNSSNQEVSSEFNQETKKVEKTKSVTGSTEMVAKLLTDYFRITADSNDLTDIPDSSDKLENLSIENQVIPDKKISLNKKLYPVTKVVDGDTLAVLINGKSETLRLIGIDTPETVDPRKPVQCFGEEASNQAKKILTGKKVSLESDPIVGQRDKYNRLLVYVYLEDGTNFNQQMIKEGYAFEYTYNNQSYKYQQEFKEAQGLARTNQQGLWSPKTCNGTNSKGQNQSPSLPSQPSSGTDRVDKNCADFNSQSQAQAYFESIGGSPTNNADRLDGDHDGIACESLR